MVTVIENFEHFSTNRLKACNPDNGGKGHSNHSSNIWYIVFTPLYQQSHLISDSPVDDESNGVQCKEKIRNVAKPNVIFDG